MSVIMRNICGGGSGSSSSKGFPPGDVTNVSIETIRGCSSIKFSDPSTSIYNGTTLSTWSSTIIVRKEGSAPSSIKDGDIVLTNTIKDAYVDTPYTDSNVVVGKTYYYRFYTLSTDKIYNDSTSMIYSVTVKDYDPILKNNSWNQISAASEDGLASSLWKVGDEIDLTLSGAYNETVTLQIWDFNHFDKSDGSGKAGICFGMKNLMKNTQTLIPNYPSNSGGWNASDMKKTTVGQILKSMPSNLQSYIKEVNTYANKGGSTSSYSDAGRSSEDKVFLPGCTEVGFTYQSSTESNQKKFPIFTDNNSRIKKMNNGSGDASPWWTRSPYYGDSDFYCRVYSDGSRNHDYSNFNNGVCFCFNV